MGTGFGGDFAGFGGLQVGPAAPVDFAKWEGGTNRMNMSICYDRGTLPRQSARSGRTVSPGTATVYCNNTPVDISSRSDFDCSARGNTNTE